jgi:predicted nucleic acid-binding protein
MLALDASVLLHAVNRHTPEHPRAARVVEDLIHGDRPWALPVFALIEFLEHVTHPHAVARPLRPADAWAFVDPIVSSETGRLLVPGRGYAVTLGGLIAALETQEGLPPGVETAALLREHGVRELYTYDRSMSRYPFLTVLDPSRGGDGSPARSRRRYRTLRTRPIR